MTPSAPARTSRPSSRAPRAARLALAAAAFAGLLACSGDHGPAQGAAARPVPVRAATAEERAVPLEVHAIGNVAAAATVSVRARVGGELRAVHFREGEEVRRGELLFTLDRRPFEAAVAQAEAQLERDLAQLAKAEADVRRFGELVKDDFVTREQFDQARASADALAAAVKGDRAALESARLDLEYAEIRSPIEGRAGDLLVDAGNLVKANGDSPLVVIHQVRPIEVSFAVPERYLGPIRSQRGAGRELEVRCVPGPGEAAIAGVLAFVDNSVDTSTGTVRLKARFDNSDGRLWPGEFVDTWLVLGVERNAIVVPAPAVQSGQGGRFVYVISGDGTVARRPVTVDRTFNGDAVLAEGVEAGERVVTDGQLRLTPGASVTVVGENATPGEDGSP